MCKLKPTFLVLTAFCAGYNIGNQARKNNSLLLCYGMIFCSVGSEIGPRAGAQSFLPYAQAGSARKFQV